MRGYKYFGFIMLLSLLECTTFNLKAEDPPCEEALVLSTSPSVLLDESQLNGAGKEAFATYVKNVRVYNSTFFSKAIFLGLMGSSFWVSKNQAIERLKMLPSISDSESLKAISTRIALIFLELFNDDFKVSDTSKFVEMAKLLGVEQKELHLILSNWRAHNFSKDYLNELTSMIEYLLINESDRIELRLRNLPISISQSLLYRAIRKRSEVWEVLLNPKGHTENAVESARKQIIKSLKGRLSTKLRSCALHYAVAKETSQTTYLIENVNIKLQSLFEIPEDHRLSYDYILTKILNILKTEYSSFSASDIEFILNVIENKIKVRSYAGANMFYVAMVEDKMRHSLMVANDIPTQLELFYLILKKLDFSTLKDSDDLRKISFHILSLSSELIELGRDGFFQINMNSAENRADILDYIKYYVEKRQKDFEAFQRGLGSSIETKIQKRLPSEGHSFSPSDELDRTMGALKVAVENWVPAENDNALRVSPLGKIKMEAGKVIEGESVFVEGVSYSFEDLPAELQKAIEEKTQSKDLDFSFWAFSEMTTDNFKVFSADHDFNVKFKPMNDYY